MNIGITPTTLSTVVASQESPQTQRPEHISIDFAGAGHSANVGGGMPYALDIGGQNAPERLLPTATGAGAANVAAAPSQAMPPNASRIDANNEKFLVDWAKAVTEGPDTWDKFYLGVIGNSVAAAEARLHTGLKSTLITLLDKLPEHLRLSALTQLLTHGKGNTLDLVTKFLPTIEEAIPEKDKKALTGLLDSIGFEPEKATA
ncbi:hypothetical protein [Pandoraea commovens]|uniref:Uncharacterized protein n=1 Tax=Pandoraea commovens TaxID=2508289 RepID=A0ABY5QBE6_9BURK|nr:hypothetical protein [Pandoraea commovens]UVA78101.1 hypothetical protein NTU39_18730 [Pandoraea commovens]